MVWQDEEISNIPQVEEERVLLRQLLRLWVATRRGNRPQRVIGEEKLGMLPQILDRSKYDYGEVPVPPIIGFVLILHHGESLHPITSTSNLKKR